MNVSIKYFTLINKSFLSLLLIIVFNTSLAAQEYSYVSFPDSGAIWSEVYYPPFSSEIPHILERFAVNGEDTVINSLTYKKLYIFYDTVFNKENARYVGGIREDSAKRVYYIADTIIHDFKPDAIALTPGQEMLLYDFSVNVGDTLWEGNFYPIDEWLVVNKIDSFLIKKKYRKRIHFEYITSVKWIEGIGNIRGLLFTSGATPTNGLYNDLICFKQNDSILYFNENYTDCIPAITYDANEECLPLDIILYPNPVKDNLIRLDFGNNMILSIKIIDCKGMVIDSKSNNNNPCFSLSTEKYSPGIYFYIATNALGIAYTGKFVVQ
ncbi:MAG: T9SS type A sorting domain-containing protein [Bacteroidales bacterium]|nr:T9SS type A sorting domain-containing protein [Bacteroidales bacterium]